jgi:hypothetical protein
MNNRNKPVHSRIWQDNRQIDILGQDELDEWGFSRYTFNILIKGGNSAQTVFKAYNTSDDQIHAHSDHCLSLTDNHLAYVEWCRGGDYAPSFNNIIIVDLSNTKIRWKLSDIRERDVRSFAIHWLDRETLGVLSYHEPRWKTRPPFHLLSVFKKSKVGWVCGQSIHIPFGDEFISLPNLGLIIIAGQRNNNTEIIFFNMQRNCIERQIIIENEALKNFSYDPTNPDTIIASSSSNIYVLNLNSFTCEKISYDLGNEPILSTGFMNNILHVRTPSMIKQASHPNLLPFLLFCLQDALIPDLTAIICGYLGGGLVEKSREKVVIKTTELAESKQSNEFKISLEEDIRESGYFEEYKKGVMEGIGLYYARNPSSLPTLLRPGKKRADELMLFTKKCELLFCNDLYKKVGQITSGESYTRYHTPDDTSLDTCLAIGLGRKNSSDKNEQKNEAKHRA